MKHLEIYADGSTYNKIGSGFAVILLSMNHCWKRSFSIAGHSANSAALQAVKFGLLSIAESFHDMPIKIFVRNNYVKHMFEKSDDGYFKASPKANKHTISEIRSIIKNRNVKVLIDRSSNNSLECKKLTETAVKEAPIDNRK